MHQSSQSTSPLSGLLRREDAPVLHEVELAQARETAENMAILHRRQQNERLHAQLRRWLSFWPIGAGLLLAACAPLLCSLAQSLGSWGVPLVFPFAVLAGEPEVQAIRLTRFLPDILLYAQFPLEGWMALIVLRRRSRPLAVAGQVLLFHCLGITEILLLHHTTMPLLLR